MGILAPFILQIGITFLYSTIKYETLETSLIATISIYLFPILILYLMAPRFIGLVTNLKKELAFQVDTELDNLVLSDRYGQEKGRTQLLEDRFPSVGDIKTISSSIKDKLTPLIVDRAYDYYKDNYYSRDESIKQERSLNYYESMVLFGSLTLIFFAIDLIIVWIISFTTLNIYFIELNRIETPWITLNISIILLLGISVSFYIFRYASGKMQYYLPYAVPILFNEKTEEQYLRRETIRSIVNYNFDNLIDRRDQRRIQSQIKEVLSSQLNPLLRQEIMISARTEFAHKLAWREYSRIIEKDILSRSKSEQSSIELLTIGEKVGPVKLEEKDLLGFHSDVQYINHARKHWEELSEEVRAFVYFQLYRVVEFVMREISASLGFHEDDANFSLYSAINRFHDEGYLDDDGRNDLHNLRYRRNKLMHEVGSSLDVSVAGMENSISAVEQVLNKIKDDEQPSNR